MNLPLPKTGAVEDWNAAYYRLEDYLRAHQLAPKLCQARIILRILQRAMARHEKAPGADPVQLAMEELYEEMEAWFQHVLPDGTVPPDQLWTRGRVALQIVNGIERWPETFLAWEPAPEEFAAALQGASVQARPDLSISSMAPRPVEKAPEASQLPDSLIGMGRLYGLILGAGMLTLAAIMLYLRH